MGKVQRFKSYEEAERALIQDSIENPLDFRHVENFLKSVAEIVKNPYKPGLYKFRSFQKAKTFDLDQFAKQATQKIS